MGALHIPGNAAWGMLLVSENSWLRLVPGKITFLSETFLSLGNQVPIIIRAAMRERSCGAAGVELVCVMWDLWGKMERTLLL